MSKPRTLAEILADYKKTTDTAAKDIESVPANTRAGWQTLIRQAKDKLPELRVEYLTGILKSSFGFLLSGKDAKVKEFARIATENGALLVDASKVYEKLADAVQPSIGGRREFHVTQIGQLNFALKELMQSTGYEGAIYRADLKDLRTVPTRADLVSYIRLLVTKSNGSTPGVVSAQKDIIDQAVKAEFSGKNLVVMVVGATNEDRQGLASIFTRTERVHLDLETEVNEGFARNTIMRALNPGSQKKVAVTPQSEKAPESSLEQDQTENQQE